MPKYWYEDLPYSNPFHFDVIRCCPHCGLWHAWHRAEDMPQPYWICSNCKHSVTEGSDG